jgi:uncharacterized protein
MNRDEIISTLRDFKMKYAEKYGILSLCVFGSVARGEMRDNSDVDICVSTKTPDPFLLVHFKLDLEGGLNRRVDVVRLREKMNPFLKKRIEQEGVYV